jgi:3-dehydrotetronate 4-kinase
MTTSMHRRPLLGCIADDFTGATDLANNLVRSGMRTVQTIGVPADADALVDADAIVVALKSRTIPADEAVAQSLVALRWLQAQGIEQVYFKYCSTFDSTPAGNIGPVTDALLDALHGPGQGFTIACPAFPDNQRTVFKGHLFVGDVLLSDSGMRHHPLTPMTDANLVRVLQAQTRRRVGLVEQAVVARGAEAIAQRFRDLQAEGVGIAVVDAVGNADLLRIGLALAGMPLVTAGSGIAIGLPQNWQTPGEAADQLPPATGRQAVVSGSCSVATNAQVQHFRAQGGPAFAVNPLDIAAGVDVVGQALDWAAPLLAQGSGPVLVHATAQAESVRAVQAQLGVAEAGALVEHTLSRIAAGLVQAGVRQLVVAGGETSGAVVQALGVTQMAIGPQIDPGVPWTAVQSPLCPGEAVHVALKSGNFGSTDFFAKAFARLCAVAGSEKQPT